MLNQNRFSKIIKYVFLVLGFMFLLVCWSAFYWKYERFVNELLNILKINKYENQIKKVFTSQKFDVFKYIFVFLGVLFLILSTKSLYISKNIKLIIILSIGLLKFKIRQTNRFYFLALAAMPMFLAFYFAVVLPIHCDEAWTHLYFSTRGIVSSIAYYPSTNNHIFYSLLTNFTLKIPWFSDLFLLRLPSIFAAFGSLFVCYHFIKNFFNNTFANLFLAIYPLLFLNIYYSILARGYSFLMLFFVLSLYALMKTSQDNRRFFWVIYVLSSSLGFYTMPSFLYPFVSLNVFYLLVYFKNIRQQIVYNLMTVALVLMLYTPVLLVSGIDSLINNPVLIPTKQSRAKSIANLIPFTQKCLSELVQIPHFSFIFLILVLISPLLMQKNNKKWLILCLIALLMPAVFMVANSMRHYTRVFLYYNLFIGILMVLPVYTLFKSLKIKPNLPILIAVQLLFIPIFCLQIKTYHHEWYAYQTLSQKIIKTDAKTFYSVARAFQPPFIFYLKEHKNMRDFKTKYNFKAIDLDTLQAHYDCIVLEKNMDKTHSKKPNFTAENLNIYYFKGNLP